MIIATLVLSILCLLLLLAVLAVAVVGLVLILRVGAAVKAAERVRTDIATIATERDSRCAKQLRTLFAVCVASNRFLAGFGLPPTPEVMDRRKASDDEIREAAEIAGVPLEDLLEQMRLEEEEDRVARA